MDRQIGIFASANLVLGKPLSFLLGRGLSYALGRLTRQRLRSMGAGTAVKGCWL